MVGRYKRGMRTKRVGRVGSGLTSKCRESGGNG